MLIIDVPINKSFKIGDDIIVTAVEIDDERARLVVDAPDGVSVIRKEVSLSGVT